MGVGRRKGARASCRFEQIWSHNMEHMTNRHNLFIEIEVCRWGEREGDWAARVLVCLGLGKGGWKMDNEVLQK